MKFCLVLCLFVWNTSFAQSVKHLGVDSCEYYLQKVSYFWKQDSLGRNGFRWLAYPPMLLFVKYKLTAATLLQHLGKPNRISQDNLNNTYYGYIYFDGRRIPKEHKLSWERMYIFFRYNKSQASVQDIAIDILD